MSRIPPTPAPLVLQLPWQHTKRLDHVSVPVPAIYNSSQTLALCFVCVSFHPLSQFRHNFRIWSCNKVTIPSIWQSRLGSFWIRFILNKNSLLLILLTFCCLVWPSLLQLSVSKISARGCMLWQALKARSWTPSRLINHCYSPRRRETARLFSVVYFMLLVSWAWLHFRQVEQGH